MSHQFNSPKRKRVDHAVVTQLQTSFLPRFVHHEPEDDYGDNSPRTQVSRKFQKLNLDHCDARQDLDTMRREAEQTAQSTAECRRSSPCPEQDSSRTGNDHMQHPIHPQLDAESTSTSGVTTFLSPPKENKRPKSPSLSGEISDQYWHESEITGHDPDDPTDDGYGINGIGFKPTPAIAYARSQKRKQQLSDYRNREAREARQRRSERRRGGSGESSNTPMSTVEEVVRTRVKFDDG